MRNSALLDYRLYRQLKEEGSVFRFTGNIESITDGHTLWLRGRDLTLPVSLENTKCYLLPEHEEGAEPDALEQIRWNRVSALPEGVKVFAGGQVKTRKNRMIFCSTKESPLTVIFYCCPDDELPEVIIKAARTKDEYWNSLTPVSIAIGALALISTAASFLGRPAYHLAVISAFTAVFIPVLPVMPPGFLLTIISRRLTRTARKLRVSCDLAFYNLLSPDLKREVSPVNAAKSYAIRAYSVEIFAWVLMFAGICMNIIFIFLILNLLNVIRIF